MPGYFESWTETHTRDFAEKTFLSHRDARNLFGGWVAIAMAYKGNKIDIKSFLCMLQTHRIKCFAEFSVGQFGPLPTEVFVCLTESPLEEHYRMMNFCLNEINWIAKEEELLPLKKAIFELDRLVPCISDFVSLKGFGLAPIMNSDTFQVKYGIRWQKDDIYHV